MDPLVPIIISSCWGVFMVIWLLAAIFTKRTVYHESGVRRLRYLIPIVFGWYLVFRGYRLGPPFNLHIIPQTDAILGATAILCLCGLGFCLWARAVLGRNWSGTVTLKEDHELIRARSLPAGPPSHLHWLTCHAHRDVDGTGTHRGNDRARARVHKLLDQIEQRRRSDARAILRSISRVPATHETHCSVHPLN
jgi:hypothetical protein